MSGQKVNSQAPSQPQLNAEQQEITQYQQKLQDLTNKYIMMKNYTKECWMKAGKRSMQKTVCSIKVH